MDFDNEGKARTIGDSCPRCSATGATMTLLTSWVRYFMCGHCQCTWQISRSTGNHETDT